MFLLPHLLIFLISIKVINSIHADIASLPTNVLKSFKNNIIGKCKYNQIVPPSSILNNNEFSTSLEFELLFPSKEEIYDYKSLPHIYTGSNEALGLGIVNGVPFGEKWSQSNTNSWQLPPTHPRYVNFISLCKIFLIFLFLIYITNFISITNIYRQNKSLCIKFSKESFKKPTLFYNRNNSDLFYIFKGRNGFIADSGIFIIIIYIYNSYYNYFNFFINLGIVHFECGYIQLHEACETIFKFIGRKLQAKCMNNLKIKSIKWNKLFNNKETDIFSNSINNNKTEIINEFAISCVNTNEKIFKINQVKSIFVITASWDNNYHHFIVDSITRLFRHLKFLQDNPDIMILIRGFEQYAKKERYIAGGTEMRLRLLNLLNISVDRVIYGIINLLLLLYYCYIIIVM
jgi:hypothetical protein